MALSIQSWAHQIGWYMLNCVSGKRGDELFKIVEGHAERLATRMSDEDETSLDSDEQDLEAEADDLAAERLTARQKMSMDKRRRELRAFLSPFAGLPPSDGAVEENVGFAVEEFGLSELDVSILLFIIRYRTGSLIEAFSDDVFEQMESVPAALGALLGVREEDVAARLGIDSPLVGNGAVVIDRGGLGLSGVEGQIRLTPALAKGMRRPHDSREAWVASLLGRPLTADLEWGDHGHLGATAELARNALIGWPADPVTGINLMLVGPPGTGKSEFAKNLAAASNMRLWSVGEAEEGANEPGRAQRIAALRLAFAVLRHKRDCMLMVDEASDVLLAASSFGSNKGSHSKLFLNRTLETNPVPVIWACNEVSGMDDATLRRMTHVIEMKVPDRSARRKIWVRVLERERLPLGGEAAARLADRWPAAPAVAANAARMARLAGGGETEVEIALYGAMRALGTGATLPERDGKAFDPELTVCAEDLDALARDLSAPGASRRWSACLFGPPGTGKSEFARYLAARLGLPVHHLRGSDLLSKYVGESEKNIAAAFTEARARGAMLIIDEVEAMIFNRAAASHSWEVSQVDEMLTWMEDHPLPFVATTNTMAHLDAASLRRFDFKLRFDNLDQARAELAFRRILGEEPPAESLPEGLAPGDFALVRNKTRLRGPQPVATLVRWLREEADAKGAVRGPVGFRTGGRAPEKALAPRS